MIDFTAVKKEDMCGWMVAFIFQASSASVLLKNELTQLSFIYLAVMFYTASAFS